MNNEITKYVCDTTIENFFIYNKWRNSATNISKIFSCLKDICKDYDLFINDLEIFFNAQIKSESDFNQLNGDVVELSDETERIFFPFKKVDGQLKFVETDMWRVAIMSAIASSKLEKIIKDNEEKNEQYISTKLQFIGL
jgi:hypothetical protein